MAIHGIFSSYFGEDEFDVGKAVRENQMFFDTEYVLDRGGADRARSYLVDWAKTFDDVIAGYYQSSPPFFEPGGAEEWRRTAFEKADKEWDYGEQDWVCFVDATEGLSIDESLEHLLPFDPADPSAGMSSDPNLYKPWLAEEIEAASDDQISFPVYVFIGNSPVWLTYTVLDPALQVIIDTMTDKDIYLSMTKHELNTINHAVSHASYQSWTLAGWSPRMFRVGSLRDLDFDWTSIDTFIPSAPSDATTIGTSIVSYAYARWTDDFDQIDRSVQRPMSEEVDDGWRMRQKISRVRPVTGLPFDDWDSPDIAGRTVDHAEPPPDAHPVDREYNDDFTHDFANFNAIVPTQPGEDWDPSWDSLMTLYPEVIRSIPREGVYFLTTDPIPVPWNFYTGQPMLTAAQTAVREAYVDTQEQIPQKVFGDLNSSPEVVGVEPNPHPNDTITPEGPTVEPPDEDETPPWNKGKWNRGKW